MSDFTNIARPYAQAVFDIAQEQKDYAAWGDQLEMLSTITSDASFQDVVNKPSVENDQLFDLIKQIAGDKLQQDGVNLVQLLLKNDRVLALPDIARVYAEKRSEAERILDADCITATEMNDDQKKTFAQALEKRLDRTVRLTYSVDESLVGGAIIRAGDWVVDGSVKAQLDKLVGALSL